MEFMRNLFFVILNMGITAGYVIIAVLLIRILISKAPKAYFYALWSVVAFRLVCPISFPSLISILNIGSLSKSTISYRNGFVFHRSIEAANMAAWNITTNGATVVNTAGSSRPVTAVGSGINNVINIAVLIWIAGIIVFLIYSMNSYLQLRKMVSKAVSLRENIYECDQIPSPFVLGLLKPRIYIPFRLKPDELDFILKHEQFHIRRFDHVIKPLSYLLLTVYWFNPMVWIAYHYMVKDMEMSCDERVLCEAGASIKKEYSKSLLGFAENKRFPTAGPLTFGETNTKGRIKNILRFKRPKFCFSVLAGILCMLVVIACAANPKVNQESVLKDQITEQTKEPVTDQTVNKSVNRITNKTENKNSDQSKNKDIINSKNSTDYAKKLYECKNPYIGDASADTKLLNTLGVGDKLGHFTIELETSEKPYILRLVFEKTNIASTDLDHDMIGYATMLLALIDNADEIQWRYPYSEDGKDSQITVSWNDQNLEAMSITDIKSYGKSKERVLKLLDTINTDQYKIE